MDVDAIDHVHSSWCLLLSTVLLTLTAVSTAVLRSVIRHRLTPSLSHYCLLDFLCGVELCVCGLELGTVLDIYDIPIYSLFLWAVLVWQSISWGDSTANPYGHLLRWWEGGEPLHVTGLRILAGAAGALASFSIIAPIWQLELSHFHQDRAHNSSRGVCGTDLQISVLSGLLVELFGTLACFLSGSLLQDLPPLSSRPLLVTCLDNAVGVALVIAAFDLTGGYYNPALAAGLKLGCGPPDPAHLTHLAVYWVGPCVGALMAAPVYKYAKNIVGVKNQNEKKE